MKIGKNKIIENNPYETTDRRARKIKTAIIIFVPILGFFFGSFLINLILTPILDGPQKINNQNEKIDYNTGNENSNEIEDYNLLKKYKYIHSELDYSFEYDKSWEVEEYKFKEKDLFNRVSITSPNFQIEKGDNKCDVKIISGNQILIYSEPYEKDSGKLGAKPEGGVYGESNVIDKSGNKIYRTNAILRKGEAGLCGWEFVSYFVHQDILYEVQYRAHDLTDRNYFKYNQVIEVFLESILLP